MLKHVSTIVKVRAGIVFALGFIWFFGMAYCQQPSRRYDRYIKRYAILHGISPSWVKAVAIAESSMNPNAVSWVGARGLMQFMPATWEWQAPSYYKALGPNNPKAAIWVGCKYLKWNLNRVPDATLDNGERLASASYNSGWGNVRKARAACKDKGGGDRGICDREVWYSNVEFNLVTSARSQEETIGYVKRIDRWKARRLF